MKIPEKLKNLTMLDLARGPWLFILSVCGSLTGLWIFSLLSFRTEDPFKFSLIDTWLHVTRNRCYVFSLLLCGKKG